MRSVKIFIALFSALGLLAGFGAYLHSVRPVAEADPLESLRGLPPGSEFSIPDGPGFWSVPLRQDRLLARVATRELSRQEVLLCNQLQRKGGPMIGLHVGRSWAEVAQRAERYLQEGKPRHAGLANTLLDTGRDGLDIPALLISGWPRADFVDKPGAPLQVDLKNDRTLITLSDLQPLPQPGGQGAKRPFRRDFWMFWEQLGEAGNGRSPRYLGNLALHVERYRHPRCELGMLRVSLHGLQPEPAVVRDWPVRFYPGGGRAGEKRKDFNLAPGSYRIPPVEAPRLEDAELYDTALALGLIRLDDEGLLQVSPSDLDLAHRLTGGEGALLPLSLGEWARLRWDERVGEVHRALHGSYAGRYIRRQIDRFNRERLILAARMRTANAPMEDLLERGELRWRAATVGGVSLTLTAHMPVMAGRLLPRPSADWRDWKRVAGWPKASATGGRVQLSLRLPAPARGDERMELLLVGANPRLQGAVVIGREERCLSSACPAGGFARLLLVDLNKGVTALEIDIDPRVRRHAGELFKGEFRHIRLVDGVPRWHGGKDPSKPSLAQVSVHDARGRPLWFGGQLTPEAEAAGLLPLLGAGPGHESSVAGLLSRLGSVGLERADARLTLDLDIQRRAQAALDASVAELNTGPFADRRRFALLVMEPESGAVLAVANGPGVPPGLDWSELAGMEIADAAHSPLRLHAWQHDGSAVHAPGSTFKLLTALALERLAATDGALEQSLAGLSENEMNTLGSRDGFDFRADDPCYPAAHASCTWNEPGWPIRHPAGPVIHNYGRRGKFVETPKREMDRHKDVAYGLAVATSATSLGCVRWWKAPWNRPGPSTGC